MKLRTTRFNIIIYDKTIKTFKHDLTIEKDESKAI